MTITIEPASKSVITAFGREIDLSFLTCSELQELHDNLFNEAAWMSDINNRQGWPTGQTAYRTAQTDNYQNRILIKAAQAALDSLCSTCGVNTPMPNSDECEYCYMEFEVYRMERIAEKARFEAGIAA